MEAAHRTGWAGLAGLGWAGLLLLKWTAFAPRQDP